MKNIYNGTFLNTAIWTTKISGTFERDFWKKMQIKSHEQNIKEKMMEKGNKVRDIHKEWKKRGWRALLSSFSLYCKVLPVPSQIIILKKAFSSSTKTFTCFSTFLLSLQSFLILQELVELGTSKNVSKDVATFHFFSFSPSYFYSFLPLSILLNLRTS